MTIAAEQVTPIIVTRGNVNMEPIVRSLCSKWDGPFPFVIVRDNSLAETDLSVYGRYDAIDQAKTQVILVQDDDVILSPEAIQGLLAAYELGKLVANMPPVFRARYPDTALVGFGAIFDRDLPVQAFAKIGLGPDCSPFPENEWLKFRRKYASGLEIEIDNSGVFRRTCDLVFATLTPRILVDLPFKMLPHTWAPNRMYRTKGNTLERKRMLELCRKVRDGA